MTGRIIRGQPLDSRGHRATLAQRLRPGSTRARRYPSPNRRHGSGVASRAKVDPDDHAGRAHPPLTPEESLRRHGFREPFGQVDDIIDNASRTTTQADGATVHIQRAAGRGRSYHTAIANDLLERAQGRRAGEVRHEILAERLAMTLA
jgi:hypothetical protein